MNKTSIEWTDYTWNPVTGCNKISQGCKNCYAETIAKRFWGDRKFTDVKTHQERLSEVRRSYKKWYGKKVFVCSMSDLFHEDVPFEFIGDVFREFYYLPGTIFQILTKRPQRALEFTQWLWKDADPLGNVWIGTSCEDQATADQRIPLLLQIPAAVRFLSCEPLLGPIDISSWFYPKEFIGMPTSNLQETESSTLQQSIHWVIAGGESGHGARPMHPDWVRSLRDQCNAANVPFFFKQWGEYAPGELDPDKSVKAQFGKHIIRGADFVDRETHERVSMLKLGKSKSGNLLDGVQHLNFPL